MILLYCFVVDGVGRELTMEMTSWMFEMINQGLHTNLLFINDIMEFGLL